MADHILGVDGPSVTIPTGVVRAGGLTLADTYDEVQGFDGTRTFGPGEGDYVSCINTFPDVDWLDTSGNILTPGLYVLGVTLHANVPGSATGQFALVMGPVGTQIATAPLDALAIHWPRSSNVANSVAFPISYSAADSFPTNTRVSVEIQSTATGWSVNAQTFVQRLAYPA